MEKAEYDATQGDDGCWYVNRYWRDEAGDLRRDTPWDGLTEEAAASLARTLNTFAQYETTNRR